MDVNFETAWAPHGWEAAWAPDGREMAYIKSHELHVARSDGVEVRRLCAVTGTPINPSWSPDGSRIRFDVRDAFKFNSIWEMSRDGTNLHRLLPGWREDHCCGSWTQDANYFVFSSAGNTWAIREKTRLFQRATREPVQLTTGPMQLGGPVLSPDGKRIYAMGQQRRTELARYDSKSDQFLPYLGGISAEGLDFSRDGRWVVYGLYPEGTLWRAKSDGSERQQLTFPPLIAGMPRWSPNGKEIAFQGSLPGKWSRIYLIPADGGSPQQVTHGESSGGGESDPAWLPDGSSLAFGGLPNSPFHLPGPDKLMLRVFDLKTHQISALPGSENLWSLRWSPDGNYLAAESPDSQKLLLYNLRTREQSELVSLSLEIGYFSWSHDSEFVYFDTAGSDPAFFRVHIRDRKIERIVSLKDVRRTLGTFGSWTGLAPDDSLLLQRDAGASEIYAFDWEAP